MLLHPTIINMLQNTFVKLCLGVDYRYNYRMHLVLECHDGVFSCLVLSSSSRYIYYY